MTKQGPAAFHAYRVGSVEVCVVSDGAIAMPVTDGLALNASAEDIRRALREASLPDERLTTTFAPVILQASGKKVLIDAGLGPDFNATTNANAGLLVPNMQSHGIEPDEIDLVVVSHFHVDHINGLLSRGNPVFPNAQIAVPEREWAFWMDDAERSRVPEGRISEIFSNSRRVFDPLRDRVRTYTDGDTIVPGLEAIETPGHSIGHMSFWLRSGSEGVFVQGDLSNQAALFLPHPNWQSPLDQFPEQAVKTRRSVYDRLAAERAPVQAFHHPFPGRCLIERDGDGYRRIALA